MYLDYSLKTPDERVAYVCDILATTPANQLSSKYKQYIADYLLFVSERNQTKEEKNSEYPIITKNREITINKRQISYEQVVSSLENGEDGIYALINNDKNQLLDHKNQISEQDIIDVPAIKEQLDLIESLKKQFDKATGQRRYNLKKMIIETWQQIYILKASTKGGDNKTHSNGQAKAIARSIIPEKIYLDKNNNIVVDSPLSLLKAEHVSYLLCYYSLLKEESYEDLNGDMHWLLIDLENLTERVLRDYPVYRDLVIWKIDGLTNEEIRMKMEEENNIYHNEQYYSTLWRKRIPKMIADQARKDWLIWHFENEEYGEWLHCNKCDTWKPAHPLFFSKNTSSSGYYSICKNCRSDNE